MLDLCNLVPVNRGSLTGGLVASRISTSARPGDRALAAARRYKTVSPVALLAQARCGAIPLDRLAVDFDPADIYISAVTMAAAGHQICKTDLIDLRKIHRVE